MEKKTLNMDNNSRNISVIIPAAGQGKRMGKVSKPFLKLKGTPIIIHIINIFSSIPWVKEIIIAVKSKDLRRAKTTLSSYITSSGKKRNKVLLKLVKGGPRRQDSVANALKLLDPQTQYVLIHDVARPLVRTKDIFRLIKETKKTGAALLGVPVVDTIKRINLKTNLVKETLKPRSELYLAQTPQGFKKDILIKAYKKAGKKLATDDASLIENLGYQIKIIPGSYSNFKITTPIDLTIAQLLFKK